MSEDLIQQIEAALAAAGEFGEVRLIKERGTVRFVQTLRSETAAGSPPPRPQLAAQPTFRPDR